MNEQFVEDLIAKFAGKDKTFWDIGANQGTYTLGYGRKYGKVLAVEPHPDEHRALAAKIREDATMSHVTVLRAAVVDFDGLTEFYVNPQSRGGHITAPNVLSSALWPYGRNATAVDGRTLDSLAREYGYPDVVKMDIEGAEEIAWRRGLELLREKNVDVILEVHQTVDLASLIGHFRYAGYAVRSENGELVNALKEDTHYHFFPKTIAADRQA